MHRFHLIALIAALSLFTGLDCGDGDDVDDTGESDTDTDTDADADTDVDTDTDSDTDTDVGGDCAANSGWPCSCNVETCDDGAPCLSAIDGATMGFCSAECSETVACPTTSFAAQGQCALGMTEIPTNCALVCTGNGDCPSDQTCTPVTGGSLCHP